MRYIMPVVLIIIGILIIILGVSILVDIYNRSQEVIVTNYRFRQLDKPVQLPNRNSLWDGIRIMRGDEKNG